VHHSIRWVVILLLAALAGAAPARADQPSWLDKTRDHVTDIWKTGTTDLYVPIYTYHLRSAYTQQQIDRYQETPYGLGYGRSKFDQDGDWKGLYAIAYQDSHYKPSYQVGYVFQKIWRPAADWRIGGGLTAFLVSRSDTAHYFPIPVILPIGSIGYKNAALEVSFVPGHGDGRGNVLFFSGRYNFR
jgi:Antimicrobial peptide resistance and lipid A acylation protein PagP